LSDAAFELQQVLELARSQHPEPTGWSLAVNVDWLERAYFGAGALRRLEMLPSGALGACVSVRGPGAGEPGVTVTSLLRPGHEHLWAAQLAWIEAQIAGAGTAPVVVISECLTDAETHRWAVAGFDLVFEEFAMQRDLHNANAAPRWPSLTAVLEWSSATAGMSFEVYEAAFRGRPGFPGWTRSEWIDRLTGGPDFLPEASFLVLRDGAPAGFVVSSNGWIDQVGVAPGHRRLGLASALAAEASSRMRALRIGVARLHVNTNNPEALATWRKLGFRESGRRGRFERRERAGEPRAS
jgi:mycothiol synthase